MVYLNQPFGNFKSATGSLNSSEKKTLKNSESLAKFQQLGFVQLVNL